MLLPFPPLYHILITCSVTCSWFSPWTHPWELSLNYFSQLRGKFCGTVLEKAAPYPRASVSVTDVTADKEYKQSSLTFTFTWARSVSEASDTVLNRTPIQAPKCRSLSPVLGCEYNDSTIFFVLRCFNLQEYNITRWMHKSVFRRTSLYLFANVPR